MYCSQEETIDHLFVNCVFIQSIWQWIARFNNFYFDFYNIVALWDIDYCIPLKEPKLTEIIRGAVLWSLWNDQNRIIFQQGQVHNVKVLGFKVMSVARFWALHQKQDLSSKLHLIFPFDLKDLTGSTVVNFMGTTLDSTRTHGTTTMVKW